VFCAIFAMEATGSKMFSIITTISVSVVFGIISVVSICLLHNNQKDNETNSSNYATEHTFYYKQTAIAINERMFQTEDGNIWIMNNVQLEKNEKYEITFDNHDTEIITDDEIVDFIKLNEKG
jgi:hypothetical protein